MPHRVGPGRGSEATRDPHHGRRRRTRSLPSSPERRRGPRGPQVRFADALGLELAEVKVFSAAEDPSVPLHVLTRLAIDSALRGGDDDDRQLPFRYLEPDFPQPADRPDFAVRVRRQRVCLERVLSSQELRVAGTVRVLNVAFEKTVTVRYTLSAWRSAQEARAVWQSSDGATDAFAFSLAAPPFLLRPGSALRFAVRYRVGGAEYWDNNDGRDYGLVCGSHALRLPTDDERSWIHFV